LRQSAVEYWFVGSVVGAIHDVDEWAAPQRNRLTYQIEERCN
jgi:hypothetical protein